MSKLSKKLILSVLTLVLTVVALGATTFAWFTLGNEATVGQISGQITSGDGLEVRIAQGQEGEVLDNGSYAFAPILGYDTWYTSLPSSVLQEFLGKKYNPDASKLELKGVTSADGVAITKLDGTTAADYGSFIEFDLEIRSQFETEVFLSGVNLTGAVDQWASDANFKLSDGKSIIAHDNDAALDNTNSVWVDPSTAARVSVQSATSTIVYQKPEIAEDLDEEPKVARNTITDYSHKPSIYGAHDYYFVKNGSSLVTPLEKAFKVVDNSGTPGLANADSYTLVLPETVTEFGAVDSMDDADAILELQNGNDGYYYGTVTVRIWIEGWDNEAYNSIFNLELFVGLSFAKKESNQ
jgi:hypothetical protein